jgi:hypothetical protein
LPMATSTDPLACGAMFKSKLIGRIWSGARPSVLWKGGFNGPQVTETAR